MFSVLTGSASLPCCSLCKLVRLCHCVRFLCKLVRLCHCIRFLCKLVRLCHCVVLCANWFGFDTVLFSVQTGSALSLCCSLCRLVRLCHCIRFLCKIGSALTLSSFSVQIDSALSLCCSLYKMVRLCLCVVLCTNWFGFVAVLFSGSANRFGFVKINRQTGLALSVCSPCVRTQIWFSAFGNTRMCIRTRTVTPYTHSLSLSHTHTHTHTHTNTHTHTHTQTHIHSERERGGGELTTDDGGNIVDVGHFSRQQRVVATPAVRKIDVGVQTLSEVASQPVGKGTSNKSALPLTELQMTSFTPHFPLTPPHRYSTVSST